MPSADDLAERQAINKIGSNDVYVRAAKLSDATALIKLNEEFRENMLRWQQEDDDTLCWNTSGNWKPRQECHSVLEQQ